MTHLRCLIEWGAAAERRPDSADLLRQHDNEALPGCGAGRVSGFATFEWLGTSGWRVSTPTTTMLVDPYLSRFDTGLAAARLDATTPLTLDTTAIDAALGAPGDGHGSVDCYHLGQAMGVPTGQLAVV